MSSDPVPIGIAVVEHNGRYLVGRRAADTPLAGYDEFPGGKCTEQEPPNLCAVRECFEETGLRVQPVERLLQCEYTYPHATVDLHFWLCQATNPTDVRPNHNGYHWLDPIELAGCKFPPANEGLIAQLTSNRAN